MARRNRNCHLAVNSLRCARNRHNHRSLSHHSRGVEGLVKVLAPEQKAGQDAPASSDVQRHRQTDVIQADAHERAAEAERRNMAENPEQERLARKKGENLQAQEKAEAKPVADKAGAERLARETAGQERLADEKAERERTELLTLHGHTASVESVAWSPDGKRLATGSGDKTAKVWNADTGRELLTLRGHRECVRRVDWTWDLERETDSLVTASVDGFFKIWDADTGEELLEDQVGGEGWLMAWRPAGNWNGNSLAFNLDAEFSWDGSGLGGVYVRCMETGEGSLHHRDLVRSIAWSPDGMRLATGSTDGAVRVWNADAGKELLTLRGHGESVTSLAWDRGGSRLATASEDGNVKVWNASNGEHLLTLTLARQLSKVWSVAWHPFGNQVAMGTEDKTAKVWDATKGKELLALSGHDGGVWSVAWSPDGRRLATASNDKTAKVWDIGRKWP